jgi:hypothetical protein
MQVNPIASRNTETHHLPPLNAADEHGIHHLTGRVLNIADVDPIYGADAGTRLALIYHESATGVSTIVPLTLTREMAPTLKAGQRVRAWGVHEPLSVKMPDRTLEMGVLAALDIHPA